MSDTKKSAEAHKAMFLDFVAVLSATTMQQLGKIISPLTGKAEVNLEAAQATIDMLEMIEVKTRGNRDRDEDRFLANTLTTLRMNFVETRNSPPPRASDDKPASPSDAPDSQDRGKETRFHKSYG